MLFVNQQPSFGDAGRTESVQEVVQIKRDIFRAASEGLTRLHWEHGDHDLIRGYEYAMAEYLEAVEYALKEPKNRQTF
jgi:hypothetical protein